MNADESDSLVTLRCIAQQELNKVADIYTRRSQNYVFSHITALRLLGIEVPNELADEGLIHVTVASRARRSHLRGAQFHLWSNDLEIKSIGSIGKFRTECYVTTPPVCLAQMAGANISDEILVVLADAMMRRDLQLKRTTLMEIRRYIRRCHEFPGKSRLVRLLPSMREDTDSSWETRLRLLLESAGMTGLVVNQRVRSGNRTWYLDLAMPSVKVAFEYQGAGHASLAQSRADYEKANRLGALGWRVIFVSINDLRTEKSRREFLRIVQSVLASAHICV